MTEREQHEPSPGSTGGGGYRGQVSRAAVFVAVALLVCALAVGFAGTAAAQDAVDGDAVFEDQVASNNDEVLVEGLSAVDSNGNNVGGLLVAYRTITGSDGFTIEEAYIAGTEDKTADTLNGNDVPVDISTLINDGNKNVGDTINLRIALLPESVANDEFSDVSPGDRLDAGDSNTDPDPAFDALLNENVLEEDNIAPQGYLYEAETDASDVTIQQDGLGSVTVQPDTAANLATFRDYGDGADDRGVTSDPNDFRVSISDRRLEIGEDDEVGAVLDVSGTQNENTGGGLTFDLSGEGLNDGDTLYVNVHDELKTDGATRARDGDVAESFEQDVSSAFTLNIQQPDLQVTNVAPQDGNVVEGEDVLDVDVTVENQGDAEATDQTVTLEVDSNQDGSFTQEDSTKVTVGKGNTNSSITLSYTTQDGDASAVDVRVTTEDDTEGITKEASIQSAAPDTITNGDASPDPIDPGETSTVTGELLRDGSPLDGADVEFSHDGNGDLTVTQGTSDTNGVVEAEYTADIRDAGETVTVTIESADDSTVTENVDIGVNDATLSLSLNAVEPVDPVTGGNANEVQLKATLTGDGPIEGEPISFSIDTGNGGLSNADGQTDANGEATVTYTVGENDWDTGVEVSVELDADTSVTATKMFDVSEPDLTIGVTSAQNDIPPTGENDVTATVTYEAPFENQEQENVGVTFGVVNGAGSLDSTNAQTDTNGEATVTYDPAEADFGETVEVFGAAALVEEPVPETSSITTQQEPVPTQDSTTFDVQEPVEVNATADLGVTAPGGVGITFELSNPDIQDTQLSGTTSEGDGEVTVNFDQDGNGEVLPAGDYTVKVVSADGTYQTGVSDTVSVNAGNTGEVTLPLDGEDATVDVKAKLGVTAPEDGFDVNVDIGVPGGTDVSETVTLQKGDSTLTDSTDSSMFSVGAINKNEQYDVTVSADGYADASATGYVKPGDSGVINVSTLVANALDIKASSELGVPLSGRDSVDVTYTLEGPEENEEVKTDEGVTDTSSVVFASVEALDAGEKYSLTADADGYEEKQATTPGAPGDGTEGIDEEADLGALNAVPAEVTAEAELEAEPGEDTTVTFRLLDEGGVVDTQTDEVGPNETETDNVTLTADFSGDAGAGETYEVKAETTDGNDNYTADTETVGELGPGDEETADGLFLDADPATVDALAELEAAPGEDTTVTFRLLDETDSVVDEGTDEVGPGETETDNVTLTADFSEEGINAGQYTVEASVTGGNERYTDNETGVGDLHPGDATSVDDLLLEVVEVDEENGAPRASFTFSPSFPTTGEEVNFFALSSNPTGPGDPDGSIVNYEWDLDGDGTTDRTTSIPTVSHSYSSPGTYTVSLTVIGNDGKTDSATRTITVSSLPDRQPTASFTFSPSDPNTSDTVEFDASDSTDSDGEIQSYEWDFGDGTTATGETPSHSYSSSGTYTVTLTVTDDTGATDTTTRTVSVGDRSGCPTDPVVCTYDPNGDIGTGELQQAIGDFVSDEIETADLQTVINAFIQSQ